MSEVVETDIITRHPSFPKHSKTHLVATKKESPPIDARVTLQAVMRGHNNRNKYTFFRIPRHISYPSPGRPTHRLHLSRGCLYHNLHFKSFQTI
jgi:uncharacterized protein YicC (UPF0701 family)